MLGSCHVGLQTRNMDAARKYTNPKPYDLAYFRILFLSQFK